MTDRTEQVTDEVERTLVLPAPSIEVWDALTGPGVLADDVELDLQPGGDAIFRSADEVKSGWVEEARPPEHDRDEGSLIFWWSVNGDPATRVALTLVPEPEGQTRLRVLESRPLEVLDAVGIPMPGQSIPMPGQGGAMRGPAMLAGVA